MQDLALRHHTGPGRYEEVKQAPRSEADPLFAGRTIVIDQVKQHRNKRIGATEAKAVRLTWKNVENKLLIVQILAIYLHADFNTCLFV